MPLDWDHPKGRTIGLALIRHLASRPEQRIGTLFINPGGPGESGVGLLQGDPEGIDALAGGRFDVVSWDPRGTNASTRVRCFRSQRSESRFWAGETIPTTKSASKAFEPKVASLARRCGKVSGWLLPHISTADTARDLDHLRALMGEQKLTYVGLSYGTFLGQTYANMFPDRIRAMLLDGLVDPTSYSKGAEARVAGGIAPSDEVYGKFLSLCQSAGAERCALAGGAESATERFKRLSKRLQRKPIPALGVRPPLSSDQTLSYGDLLLSQFNPLRAPSTWPANAANLAAALRGDGSALESTAAGFSAPSSWAATVTSSAISCADAPARRKLHAWPKVIRRFKKVSWLQGGVQGWWLWAPCADWPVRGQDSYRGPWTATTPNPILLIGTRYDPNTAYANAVHVDQLLGNAVLLTHEGYGHLSFQDPSACVDKATVAYLTELTIPQPGTVCQSDRQPFDRGFARRRARAKASAPTPAHGRFSGRVAIRGGRKLFLECRGRGTPTVVLEAGTGDLAQIWSEPPIGPGRPVLRAVSRFTRVCAYDRPGTYLLPDKLSRSDPVAMPRSALDIVRDEQALLRAARIPGPFVLAGHSFGGMTSRLYATLHPAEIAGLVSIDAQNEDFVAAYKRLLTPEQYSAAVLNPGPPPGLENYAAVERLDLEVSAAQMRQAQADTPLQRMPLVVLSHSRTLPNPFGFPPDWPTAALDQAFQASQDRLATLVPGARHVIATKSGHYIQLDQPKLVTRAIRSVVRKARRGRR